MRTDELDYDLPADRIATAPAQPRDAARLMVVRRNLAGGGEAHIEHAHVRDLPRLGVFKPGDLMIVNRTRVLPAWFEAVRAGTDGRVRGLYLNTTDAEQWEVMLEARGKLAPGEQLTFMDKSKPDLSESASEGPDHGANVLKPSALTDQPPVAPHNAHPNPRELGRLTLIESLGSGRWRAAYESELSARLLLERIGRPPLPPYIRRARRQRHEPEFQPTDKAEYNTVYANEPGSVAAPTAGLHFTSALLEQLDALGVVRREVVLEVGLGTFEPIRVEELDAHAMHRERLHVPGQTVQAIQEARAMGRRIIPIGTTTVRALESLPAELSNLGEGYTAQTELFIHPDANFTFRFTDALMTNFHLPRSTLLAMIASLPGVGIDSLKAWYREAIDHGYRFYSYGDAMLLV